MERLWATLILVSLLLTACYALPTSWRPGRGLMPVYSPDASPVLRYRREAGYVPPGDPALTEIAILGTGSWTATRSFREVQLPVIATGSLTPAQLQQLVERAFEPPDLWTPPFTELASVSVFPIKEQAAATLTLRLKGGQHEVQVIGTHPVAFQRMTQAIAGATGLGWAELLPE